MSDDVTGSSREVDVVDQESVDIDVVLVSSTSETESPKKTRIPRPRFLSFLLIFSCLH